MSPPTLSPEDRNRSSLPNVEFFKFIYIDNGRWKKLKKKTVAPPALCDEKAAKESVPSEAHCFKTLSK
jgi:hypothetical protein